MVRRAPPPPPARAARAALSALALAALLAAAAAAQDLAYLDARTRFDADFLQAACRRPLHGSWARCVAGGGGGGGEAERRPGRALVVPPFPRFAVVNPMHALADHVWAFATVFSACVAPPEGGGDGGAPPTIVLMGVRRAQVEGGYSVERDITARLDLDLDHLIPVRPPEEMPDPLAGPPTWGQWLLHLWARASVPAAHVLYEDDVAALPAAGLCLDGAVLALDADFFGTAFRTLRINFRPPAVPDAAPAALPWADVPERWKMRGIADLRRAVAGSLGLPVDPRARDRARGGGGGGAGGALLRVLVTTRRGDTRRRWRNADDGVAALRAALAGEAEVRVVDKLEGMSFAAQARAYNWADVLVGVHGASMANALFMRDGAAVVEVWRCCHERVEGGAAARAMRPWTGWLLSRMHMALSYLGCTEVDAAGVPLVLAADERGLSTDDLCSASKHMNPMYVDVDSAALAGAVRAAAAAALDKFGSEPIPRLSLTPPRPAGRGARPDERSAGADGDALAMRPEAVERAYAPVGPAWTVAAVGDKRAQEVVQQFHAYLELSGRRVAAFWDENGRRHERGLAPLTLDSVVEPLARLNWTFAWHVGIVPPEAGPPPESAPVAAPTTASGERAESAADGGGLRRRNDATEAAGGGWARANTVPAGRAAGGGVVSARGERGGQRSTSLRARMRVPVLEERWILLAAAVGAMWAVWRLTLCGGVRLSARKQALAQRARFGASGLPRSVPLPPRRHSVR